MNNQRQWKTREDYLAEKKRLEENGLIPDYDYPGSSSTNKTKGYKPRPSTALNDNPGPYGPDYRQNKGKSFSFTCTKNPPRSQYMWVDKESQKRSSKMDKSQKITSLPVDILPEWSENNEAPNSVYQNTHNAQALSNKKLKPERRGRVRPWNYYTYDQNDGPAHTIQSRPQKVDYWSQTPGPGAYHLT